MKALDLFCGAGGASVGLHKAGFNVVGVDTKEQPEYPFNFIKGNALEVDIEYMQQFDLIWSSPPCQAYTWGTRVGRTKKFPRLIEEVRALLLDTGKPFVIENVCSAPIRKDLILCGEMFGLKVIRHRAFEIHGFNVKQPVHKKHRGTVSDGAYIGVWDTDRPHVKKVISYVTVAGHGGNSKVFTLKSWQHAMDIDWINDKKMLAEAIPPAYSQYIGNQSLNSFPQNPQKATP